MSPCTLNLLRFDTVCVTCTLLHQCTSYQAAAALRNAPPAPQGGLTFDKVDHTLQARNLLGSRELAVVDRSWGKEERHGTVLMCERRAKRRRMQRFPWVLYVNGVIHERGVEVGRKLGD